ncbi:hypothetical protein Tco_0974460 [Tanacetum coccineum]|uniref:Uncharacterized protein n=1 Tax=Tanacetum coccineum TaxID=301880 RepID=A0ABQ5EBM3_9ASTR
METDSCLYCCNVALIRKTLEEVFKTSKDTSRSSDDDPNFKEEEKRIEEEQAAKDRYWKIPVCYDDDDDEESSIPLKDTIISGLPPCVAITSALSTEKPVDSLIMEVEHLDHNYGNGNQTNHKVCVRTFPNPVSPGFLRYRNDEEEFKISSNPLFDLDEVSPIDDECDFDPSDDNSTSRPEFESFHVDYPDSGDSTIDVVEDIPVDVPNILPTHPALQMDFDFIPSHNDLGSNLDDSSPSGDSNKIYDPGICIEVESTRFLATLSPVIDTLIPFSSENDDKVFNHGVLASKEKSSSSLSLRGFKASKLFHQKSPMLIHGDNTPNLGVRHPHFYPP